MDHPKSLDDVKRELRLNYFKKNYSGSIPELLIYAKQHKTLREDTLVEVLTIMYKYTLHEVKYDSIDFNNIRRVASFYTIDLLGELFNIDCNNMKLDPIQFMYCILNIINDTSQAVRANEKTKQDLMDSVESIVEQIKPNPNMSGEPMVNAKTKNKLSYLFSSDKKKDIMKLKKSPSMTDISIPSSSKRVSFTDTETSSKREET